MPALPRNPSSMTKERLAEELRKNNIPLPRGRSKKEVYVELYERHLLTDEPTSPQQQWMSYRNMSVNTSPKLGFSSDEEEDVDVNIKKTAVVLNVNNNRNRKRASKKAMQSDFEDRLAEVEGLSDADLRNELQHRGSKPGPIVASTRAVYERKLASLLLQPEQYAEEEEEEDLSQEDEEGDSQENEDEYSDSDVDNKDASETQASSRSVSSRTTTTSSYKSQVTRLIDQESSSKARQRSVTPKTKTETVTKTTSSHQLKETGKPLVPVWLQILIFLIVAAFLILIWYNMETGQPADRLVTET